MSQKTLDGKTDSVIKHQKFEELMQRYHGQIENALYAAEQICDNECSICKFQYEKKQLVGFCKLSAIRWIMGDPVVQHDIIIPEDNTQAERKKARFDPYCEPRERTLPECEPCRGRELTI